MERQIFTTEQAAEYLQFSPDTLKRWRREATGPDYARIGNSVRYQKAALDAWVDEQMRTSTIAKVRTSAKLKAQEKARQQRQQEQDEAESE